MSGVEFFTTDELIGELRKRFETCVVLLDNPPPKDNPALRLRGVALHGNPLAVLGLLTSARSYVETRELGVLANLVSNGGAR